MASSQSPIPAWWFGPMNRQKAESILISEGCSDGMFLVRQSTVDKTKFVVCNCSSGRVLHYPINITRGSSGAYLTLADRPQQYQSLDEIVLAHSSPNIKGPPGSLLQPCPRPVNVSNSLQQPSIAVRELSLAYSNAASDSTKANNDSPLNQDNLTRLNISANRRPSQTSPGKQQEGQQETSWECSVCTYANPLDLKACEMCETMREPMRRKIVPESPQNAKNSRESGNGTAKRSQSSAGLSTTANNMTANEDVTPIPPARSASVRKSYSQTGRERVNPFSEDFHIPSVNHAMAEISMGDRSSTRSGPSSRLPQRSATISNHRPNRDVRNPHHQGQLRPGQPHPRQPHPGQPRQRSMSSQSPGRGPSLQSPQRSESSRNKERLVCEGGLSEVKGKIQKKKRWFVLTTRRLMYYQENAGELVSSVGLRDVLSVIPLPDSRRIRISTTTMFGTSNSNEMLLECPTSRVKQKWMTALSRDPSQPLGNEVPLYIEGYLVKVQPIGASNRTRWFRVTAKTITYYKDESGDQMGSVPHEYIRQVTVLPNKKEFVISSAQQFTRTGLYEVHCRCPNQAVRDKWITGLRRALPPSKFVHL